MKTKSNLLWILMMPALLFSQPQNAKSNKEKKERIEAMRIAYITEKLDLGSDEAKIFWPVYNSYEQEQKELRQTKKNMDKEAKEKRKAGGASIEKINEKELDSYMDMVFEIKDKENQLNRKYRNRKMSTFVHFLFLLNGNFWYHKIDIMAIFGGR